MVIVKMLERIEPRFSRYIGTIQEIDNEELTLSVSFFPDGRIVAYKRDDITDLDLAYDITIHKSQGSEFEAVIIPVLTQHFKMLFRNLIYTALTRAKRLATKASSRQPAGQRAVAAEGWKNRGLVSPPFGDFAFFPQDIRMISEPF